MHGQQNKKSTNLIMRQLISKESVSY